MSPDKIIIKEMKMGASFESFNGVSCLELVEESVTTSNISEQVSDLEVTLALNFKVGRTLAVAEKEENLFDWISWSVRVLLMKDEQMVCYEGFEPKTDIANLLLESAKFDLFELLSPGLTNIRDLEIRLEKSFLTKLINDWCIRAVVKGGEDGSYGLEIILSTSEEKEGVHFLDFDLSPVTCRNQFDPVSTAEFRY